MRDTRKLILWGNYFGFVVMGMIVISFGAIMPYIREAFSLSYEQGGILFALFSSSYLINGLVSGFLIDIVGKKKVLVMGNLFYVIGLAIISLSNLQWVLYLGVFITGMGWGICNTTVNVLVNDSSHGDGKAMSLLHMSFGVGAFSIPLIFGLFLKLNLTWKEMMLFLAIMSFISLILSSFMNIPHEKRSTDAATKKQHIKNPFRIFIFMAVLFFYVGSENAFNGWVVSYLIDGLDFAEGFAQNMLSTLWFVMIIGRYFIGVLSTKIDKSTLVAWSSIGAILSMVAFMISKNQLAVTVSVACVGITFAGIYPITMANANSVIHGSGIATALVISGGGFGATFMPYIGGRLADTYGSSVIIVTIIISLLMMSIFAMLNRKYDHIEYHIKS